MNLQSELDATQMEFENVIEEVGQKTEENEQLVAEVHRLREQNKALQTLSDESSKQVRSR